MRPIASTHAHLQAYQNNKVLYTSWTFDKQQVDDRIKEALILVDMDILVDLQH